MLKPTFETSQIFHLAEGDSTFAQSKHIVCVEVLVLIWNIYIDNSILFMLLVFENFLKCLLMNIKYFLHSQHTRIPRAFQSFHKQYAHHLDQEAFAVNIVVPVVLGPLTCFLRLVWYIKAGLVCCERKFFESLVYLVSTLIFAKVVNTFIDILWLCFFGESHILSQRLFYQLTGTGYNQSVCQVEELRRKHCYETANGAVLSLTPLRIFTLGVGK